MSGTRIEHELRDWLNAHRDRLPFGTEVEEVQLLSGRQRKSARRRRSPAVKSSPKGDALFVVLRPAAAPQSDGLEAQVAQLLQALRDAERTPGHSFVVLKWFRDSYLPQRDWAWAQSAEQRDRVLRTATGRGWVGIRKVPNPRNPGFDTSVISLQLQVPEVQRILGGAAKRDWDFAPIRIEGEPMSETVIRMRREARY